ncbi:unnamed protein product [Nippostrongylus brasiliensis]|uniref:TAXi_C domain-containing protein n=1 Tax=Nippostrongylus brasiliensis TaxID=27835 RepID=A0A158QXJ3_NIPBR|nr:unnamed protein product [Nippostrongylus brasiliensis]
MSVSSGLNAVFHCPTRNTLPFDLERCNPNRRSQCPSGFTCRKVSDSEKTEDGVFLCCETTSMNISDWFTDAQLTPQIFPQAPASMLSAVGMVPLDAITAFPMVRTGDEISVLNFPNYAVAVVQQVDFGQSPPQGGFLSVMTIINPSTKPFAIFFTYNLPSVGLQQLPMPQIIQGLTGRVSYIDNSTALRSSDSYRSQYVVLVYRTMERVTIGSTNSNQGVGEVDVMGGCSELKCLLTTSPLAKQLGQPFAGSIFHVTTKNVPFRTSEMTNQATISAQHALLGTVFATFFLLQR